MFADRILTKRSYYGVLCLIWCISLTVAGAAEAGDQTGVTGLWNFKVNLVEDFDDDSSDPQQIGLKVWLYEYGSTVFGTMASGEHIVGSRDGSSISLELFSLGSNSHDIKKGGIQRVSKMFLRLAKNTLTGEAVNLTPESGLQAFEIFRVKANRVIGAETAVADSSAVQSFPPDWVCDILTGILQEIFSEATYGLFAPMETCSLNKNGGGYYLFGETGPGAGREYATSTVYLPIEFAVCTERTYDFTIHSRESYISLEGLLGILGTATKLAEFLKIPISDLLEDVQNFYNRYGGFAVSLGISMNTRNMSVYVNTTSGASESLCNEIVNSGFVQVVLEAARLLGSNVEVMCGRDIKDSYTLRRLAVPAVGLACNTPVIFVYLIGTINVDYD